MSGEKKGDWWLGATEPHRLVDRRWRTTRPGDLHPRRRASDRQRPVQPPRTASDDVFDADALFRDPTPPGPRPVPAASRADAVEPWSSLGLTSNASWHEVVARHRELAKQHHPDRAGTDEAATRAAADRMASINAAFAELGRIYTLSGDR
jgi:hypothetical protein